MPLQPKYLLLLSDALIPLLGFFVWDWSLYFILLFYFLDLIAREVITHLKTKKIYAEQGLTNTSKWTRFGMLSAGLLMLSFMLIHNAMRVIQPGIDFIEEARLFWEYKELGIQQGFLLIPLVGYAAYAQYKMQFLMLGRARTTLMDTVWKQHIKSLLFIIVGAVFSIGLAFVFPVSEVVFVLGIVLAAALFTLFLDKQ